MTRFDRVLRRAEEHLDLPEPVRSRVLLEVEADLEGLYRTYRDEGLTREEAARRAEEALGLSREAIDTLVELHAPLYRRLFERFASSARRRWERIVLALLIALTVAGGVSALVTGGLLRDSSPLIWAVLALASAGLWISVREFFRLDVKREHRGSDLGGSLPLLPPLCTAILLAGALGAGLELYGLAGTMADAGGGSPGALLPGLGRATEVLTLSLLACAVLVPIAFALHRRVRRLERARAEWIRRSPSATDS